MDRKKRILKYFGKKTAHLSKRVEENFIEGDLAFISCNVRGLDDIINRYSTPECDSLNRDFLDFITDNAKYIPNEYPIVLEICGHHFSEEEQKQIRAIIDDDSAYVMGEYEEKIKKSKKNILTMFAGLIVSMLLAVFLSENTLFRIMPEMVCVLLYFFGDMFLDESIFTIRNDYNEKILAARLASMEIMFYDSYDETPLSRSKADAIIEKMLNENE